MESLCGRRVRLARARRRRYRIARYFPGARDADMAKALKRFLLFGVLPLLLLGGPLAWFERDLLLNWYYLHRLENARGDDVTYWADRTASLGAAVIPDLLRLLVREDEAVCVNAGAALECLGERWGKADPRSGDLMHQAVHAFPKLSLAGQIVVLRLTEDW